MYIAQIMTRLPIVCTPGDRADYAAKLMLDHNVGELPVCDGANIVGVVTDRDITVRGTARGIRPMDLEVRELMTQPVYTANEFDVVERATALMERRHIRRLPIVDRSGRLVGILSQTDLVRQARPQKLLPVSAP